MEESLKAAGVPYFTTTVTRSQMVSMFLHLWILKKIAGELIVVLCWLGNSCILRA